MNELTNNPAFKAYALSTAVLVINLLALGVVTAVQRGRNKSFANREDAKETVPDTDHPKVARAMRAHRNAIESILPFFAIGFLYVLTGATARGAMIYFGVFTAARILHSIVYLLEKQPWRTIFFLTGFLSIAGMTVHVILEAVK